MSKLWNWLKKLHFHKWKIIQNIDPLEEKYPQYYLNSTTQIEECTTCSLHKRTVRIYDDFYITYEKPCGE